jgi:hypothetical protein
VAEAAGRIGECRGHSVQAVEPERAARGVRGTRALEVTARAVAVLIVLGTAAKRLAGATLAA